jgi:two-component system, NtrC family, sensor histidine kinase HydH
VYGVCKKLHRWRKARRIEREASYDSGSMHNTLGIVACAGQLALSFLLILRRQRSSLLFPLALLCIDAFAWNFADLAWELTGNRTWRSLDTAVSWLTAPLGLQFVLAFVGRTRSMRPLLVVAYLFFAQLPFWADTPGWDLVFLGGAVPLVALCLGFLVIHLVRTTDPNEAIATRYMLAAMGVGGFLGSSDLWYDHVGLGTPLSNISMFASTSLATLVVTRLKLVRREAPSRLGLLAFAAALLGLLVYLSVVRWLGTRTAMTLLTAATALIAIVAVAREVLLARQVQRERTENLETLGRFSQQMAHDFKNPLAALKGALQFLKEEQKQGRSLTAHQDFLDLMLDQVERLHRVVDQYQRMGRVEPVRTPGDINDIVRDVLTMQPASATDRVHVVMDLEDALPTCHFDRDLITRALENLVQNAFEAMPQEGTLAVRTERAPDADDAILFSVTDSGAGMDVRQVEHAFDDFYTTKAQGTGLGLAFVRRVAEAHGGRVTLKSDIGKGTTIRVEIPIGSLDPSP